MDDARRARGRGEGARGRGDTRGCRDWRRGDGEGEGVVDAYSGRDARVDVPRSRGGVGSRRRRRVRGERSEPRPVRGATDASPGTQSTKRRVGGDYV